LGGFKSSALPHLFHILLFRGFNGV
jgi:hypothetical protein